MAKKMRNIVVCLVFVVAVLYLGFIPDQSDFGRIISSAALAFGAYLILSFYDRISWINILVLGILVRFILIFSFPQLSDDIYRFVWDGWLTRMGYNPYGYLPSDIIQVENTSFLLQLFENMNSPDYYTIYPPIAQLVFYLSTLVGKEIVYSSILIKLVFLLVEIATFFGVLKLLQALKMDERLSAIFFLNPLVIIEGIGNLHFEIIMICFFIWALYFLFVQEKIAIGAIFMTLSIGAKLLPLMFLPYFLFRMKGRDRLLFFGVGMVGMLIVFSPLIFGLDFANFGQSIDLYFQKFEFNGGIYYIMRYLGQLWIGYNLIHYIGPLLGMIALVLILKKAYEEEYSLIAFIRFAFFAFCSYLFLATTIHPWYLMVPIVCSVFLKWRFAILWSFLILLTYINYSYNTYYENLLIVAFEYGCVLLFMLWERKQIALK